MTSTAIIACECGAKVRVPIGGESRALCCPKCSSVLAVVGKQGAWKTTTLAAGTSAVCPICQSNIESAAVCITCPKCQQIHHQDCWTEIGGCGTYGCQHAPAADKSELQAPARLTAWGDTKTCPACGETIKSIALRCRYCQTDFHSVDPLSAADLRQGIAKRNELDAFKKNVVALFVFSLIGCMAPISLLVGLIYLLPRRQRLVQSGPLFVIMGWTSLGLSVFFSLALIAFLAMGK